MHDLRSWSVLWVTSLQKVAAPAITGLVLYLLTLAYGIRFSVEYVSLCLLSMMLAGIFIKDSMPARTRIRIFGGYIGTIITGWLFVVSILLLIGYASKISAFYSRLVLFTWFLLNPFIIVFGKWVLQELIVKLMTFAGNTRRVVIAGVTPVSKQLAENIDNDKRLGMRFLGFFEDRSPDRFGELKHGQVLGTLSELADYANRNGVDAIYIALPIKHLVRSQVLIEQLHDTTASVYYVPDIFVFDLIQSRVDDIQGIPVLALLETPFYGYNGLMKRLFDLFVASMILLLISPLMVAISVAVKMSSPGPIIFRQRRYGLAGEEITVYKFRTMTVVEDGDDIRQAQKDDDRFTPIGAWLRKRSLDELPQFINVLQGRMSIVGPRPHAVAHNELYRKLIKGYMLRHKVLPGITGWAQVNG
ncbi:MAG TPA: undecaprenyl-phosphate glucose phosphotransferase, partial [Woeseiaceae bacterium]|nr:undecaprenyl-phosphate glucose phosphotransferase [Woeseiaceae bacterium]